MSKTLLFLPDISGYTEFVQTTEISHSQHVISELLEILLSANTENLKLAEIEGDALFFYKEELISSEKLLAQVENMFSCFYSHLKILEKNRICLCNACASAPKLQLKIIAHCGDIEFINVQSKRKPFGSQVIEAHRLMKNSINSDNYVLITNQLADEIKLNHNYSSMLFDFHSGKDAYDHKTIPYLFSLIKKENIKLHLFSEAKKVTFEKEPTIILEYKFNTAAHHLLEYITNYSKRHLWTEGIDKIEFKQNEVTRIGSEHVCVIDGKKLNFITVTTDVKTNEIVYGEYTTSPSLFDALYQFFKITPATDHSCILKIEVRIVAKSIFKKIVVALIAEKILKKNINTSILKLKELVISKE
jgi:hypothetical protein